MLAAFALSLSPRLLVVVAALGTLTAVAISVDWHDLFGPVVEAVALAALAWWVWSLLPSPVRSAAKAAGRTATRAIAGKRKRQ